MSESEPTIATDLNRLIGLYRGIAKEARVLPAFSLAPLGTYFVQYLILAFGIYLEILLLPYTLIAWFLRLFKIRWRILAPATKRLRYCALWLWRGEFTPGFLVIRPMVRWQIKNHVHRRLTAITEAIYLQPDITEAQRFGLLEQVDREKKQWAVADLTQVSMRGTLPTLGIAGLGYFWNAIPAGPVKEAVQIGGVALAAVLLYMAFGFFVGSIPIKRGLFLGRSARESVWPGGVASAGGYAVEREILERLGVRQREFPIDFISSIVFSIVLTAGLSMLGAFPDLLPANNVIADTIRAYGTLVNRPQVMGVPPWVTQVVATGLWVVVLWRRYASKRL